MEADFLSFGERPCRVEQQSEVGWRGVVRVA